VIKAIEEKALIDIDNLSGKRGKLSDLRRGLTGQEPGLHDQPGVRVAFLDLSCCMDISEATRDGSRRGLAVAARQSTNRQPLLKRLASRQLRCP
jgi:hypothetical protein